MKGSEEGVYTSHLIANLLIKQNNRTTTYVRTNSKGLKS